MTLFGSEIRDKTLLPRLTEESIASRGSDLCTGRRACTGSACRDH